MWTETQKPQFARNGFHTDINKLAKKMYESVLEMTEITGDHFNIAGLYSDFKVKNILTCQHERKSAHHFQSS